MEVGEEAKKIIENNRISSKGRYVLSSVYNKQAYLLSENVINIFNSKLKHGNYVRNINSVS
jgi:hypothetical protein